MLNISQQTVRKMLAQGTSINWIMLIAASGIITFSFRDGAV